MLQRVMQTVSLELPEETFSDLVERLREVIYTIERMPRSIVVLYPDEEILRVLLAHFYGCPEDGDPETMALPAGPVIELVRDHKGFALVESSLPPPLPEHHLAFSPTARSSPLARNDSSKLPVAFGT